MGISINRTIDTSNLAKLNTDNTFSGFLLASNLYSTGAVLGGGAGVTHAFEDNLHSKVLVATADTQSTSKTTGAITTAGGLGVAKNINALGISFDAINYLNQYSEGTWTPAFGDFTGAIGSTIPNKANYVRVGDLVFVSFDIQLQIKGVSFNSLVIRNLPFSGISDAGSVTFSYFGDLNQSVVNVFGTISGTDIYIRYTSSPNSLSLNAVYDTFLKTNSRLIGTASYIAG